MRPGCYHLRERGHGKNSLADHATEGRGIALRIYLAADRIAGRLLRALEAIHRGFWLGLLSPSSLDAATAAMFSQSESYRDDEYNRSGFYYWEAAAVARHFSGARSVLVAGAGGGRELVALA